MAAVPKGTNDKGLALGEALELPKGSGRGAAGLSGGEKQRADGCG
jgi:hypothetical protein